MSARSAIRIIVTGEHEDLESKLPSELGHLGKALEWISVPVLKFERLAVKQEIVEALSSHPVDWIIFASSRAVKFWSETLMEYGIDFPMETQVACIGQKTAEVANTDGFTPDFYPTEPGTEKFLEEFEDLLSNSTIKPKVFLPIAEGGRTVIRERLKALGCEVTSVPLYRTLAREDVAKHLSQMEVEESTLILFTSPSSFDAFTQHFHIPDGMKLGSIGRFTAEHLSRLGYPNSQILPQGDFERIGELLC